MEEQESGVMLGEMIKAIGRRIWPVLTATVLVTAAAVLLFYFLLNPLAVDYSMRFAINYPRSDSGKFPDGTPFYYQDIVSLGWLSDACSADSRFSGIDVTKMVAKDDISIVAETQETEGIVQLTGKYTVTVSGKYFKNSSDATAFLRAAAGMSVVRAREKSAAVNYLIDEETFSNAAFGDRLTLLKEQRATLLSQYDEWISLFRDNYLVAGKTLKNHRAAVVVLFGELMQKTLEEELDRCGYVSLDYLEGTIASLKAERSSNERKIAALREASGQTPLLRSAAGAEEVAGTVMDLSEMIASLVARNVEIDDELAALTPENVAAFEARLNAEFDKLEAAATTVQAVSKALYEQESRVSFDTSNAERTGGTSVFLVGFAAFVLSFLISGLTAYLIERHRSKRTKEEHN